MRGRARSARAKASICCCPPESEPAGSARRSPRIGKRRYCSSMAARELGAARRRSSPARTRFSSIGHAPEDGAPLGDEGEARGDRAVGGEPGHVAPGEAHRPAAPAGRARPAPRGVLVFPAPFGPMSVTIRALGHGERDAAHRLDVAVGDVEVPDLEERRARRSRAAPPR